MQDGSGVFYQQCTRCSGVGVYNGPHGTEDPCGACEGKKWHSLRRLAPKVVLAYEIADALDVGEYAALAEGNQNAVNVILSMGIASLNDGTNTRTTLWALFDAESTTRANLIALLGE